jgi:hypothetical protein
LLTTELGRECARSSKKETFQELDAENDKKVVMAPITKETLYGLTPGKAKLVAAFLEGAAVFALSRMWSDMISSYVLGLHAEPFCETEYNPNACVSEAPYAKQFIFALIIVPIAGLIKHLCEDTGLVNLPGMWDDIPTILNYIVGWAFGNAVNKWLAGLKSEYCTLSIFQSQGAFPLGPDCIGFDFIFSIVLTLAIGLVIVAIKPLTAEIEFGSGKCVDWLEDFLEDSWAMVLRGCSVVIMVVWYGTLSSTTFLFLPTNPGFFLKLELQVLYTVAITYVATILSTMLEKSEHGLVESGKCCGLKLSGGLINTLKGLSDVLQMTFSFVVGCAWSDIVTMVFTSLGEAPTLPVLGQNVLVTIAISWAVSYYLIKSGSEYANADESSREATEAYLIINGAAFFVGWTWLVVIRDVHAWFEYFLEEYLAPLLLESLESLDKKTAQSVTAIVATFVFSLVLTIALFFLSGFVFSSLERAHSNMSAGGKSPRARAAKEELV